MSIAFASERRLLAEDELEPIQRSHFPLLDALSRAEATELARWLRARRDRARDLLREGRRIASGKGGGARGGAPSQPGAERGLAAKKQVYASALKRVNARIGAQLAAERRERHLAQLHAALGRRQDQAVHHPGAGRSRRTGGRALPNRVPRPTIPGARIGSVSQQGRNAQARRDARG